MQNAYWISKNASNTKKQVLNKDLKTNVVIIGAGLTGLSCAYYASEEIQDMIILEADAICYGASGRNTGKLSAQHGCLYHTLCEKYDIISAKHYYQANMDALQSIKEIIKKHQIECEFKHANSWLITSDETLKAQLQDEWQTYIDLKIPAIYEDKHLPYNAIAGIAMKNQAQFDPYAYGLGLAKIVKERNIPIYENSNVFSMENTNDTYTIFVNDHKVIANKVVFASQFPFIDHKHLYFTKMVCHQESVAVFNNTAKAKDMYLSIDKDPLSYNNYDTFTLAAGNAYKSGQTPAMDQQTFQNQLKKQGNATTIHNSWTSQDYLSFDHLPLIGKLDKNDPNVLFASGFQKWGNTTSNLAGKILTSYLLNQSSPYQSMFSPQRFSSVFSAQFIKENLNVAYEFIKSKFKDPQEDYPKINEAKIIQIAEHHYGVYRDENEELFIVDITCPHLGCVCNFNSADKTWDCPCHGSRFSYRGEILKGPATKGLNSYGEGLNCIDPHILK